jgi:hypothetical protein
MQRVKNENFQLHYYVDFTEKDFVKELKISTANHWLSLMKLN